MIWSLLVCGLLGSQAQGAADTTKAQGAADSMPVVSISSSPAFVLLGVTPSSIAQPGNIRDYKLDFATQSAFKTPDVSLELKPLWLTWLGHDRGFTHWPWYKRVLSSFGLAAGMVNQTGDTTATALAVKMKSLSSGRPLVRSRLRNVSQAASHRAR